MRMGAVATVAVAWISAGTCGCEDTRAAGGPPGRADAAGKDGADSSWPGGGGPDSDAGSGPAADATAADSEPALDCTPPLLFGHRGTTLFAPENTIPAYEYAMDNGGDGIEVDLRITADGALVAMHDRSLARTTDAGDLDVPDVTLEQLAALDAGAWFAPAFAGTPVPTLETVLDHFDAGSALFLFDIKEADAVEELADAVRERGLAARAYVSSTSLGVLRDVYERLPEVPALYYPPSLDGLDAIDVPNVRYVRVPKAIEDDPVHVGSVREAGFEASISGRFVQWDGENTALTALGLVNNMALTAERRRARRPLHCDHSGP